MLPQSTNHQSISGIEIPHLEGRHHLDSPPTDVLTTTKRARTIGIQTGMTLPPLITLLSQHAPSIRPRAEAMSPEMGATALITAMSGQAAVAHLSAILVTEALIIPPENTEKHHDEVTTRLNAVTATLPTGARRSPPPPRHERRCRHSVTPPGGQERTYRGP